MHLVFGTEQGRDVIIREEIGRTMRAIYERQLPMMRQGRQFDCWARRKRLSRCHVANSERIARHQRARGMAAESTKREGRARAQEFGRIEAVADTEIAAQPRPIHLTERQYLAWHHRDGSPQRHRHAVECRAHICTAQGDDGAGVEAQAGSAHRAF